MSSYNGVLISLGDKMVLGSNSRSSEYKECFRSVLCEKYNLENINLCTPTGSNDTQFRIATTFFNSNRFTELKEKYKNIYVVWGLNDVSLVEVYINKKNKFGVNETYFTIDKENPNTEWAQEYFDYGFDEDIKINELKNNILHWNMFFKSMGVKNIWMNLYKSIQYDRKEKSMYNSLRQSGWPKWDLSTNNCETLPQKIKDSIKGKLNFFSIPNLAFANKDLLSVLCEENNFNSEDKLSKINYLTDQGILDIMDNIPTVKGNEIIAKMVEKEINLKG